jgi:ubiquinone/menaquinone biosynthesis C-methylase UbiE
MDLRPTLRNLERAYYRSRGSWVFAELMRRKARHLYRPIIEEIGALPDGALLGDVGCGHATCLCMYLQKHPHVQGFGLDQSERLLRFARRQCQAASVNARFSVGDVHTFPFPESAFDGMISLSSIYCWHDPVRAINNLYVAMKPGARLLIYEVLPPRTMIDVYTALFVQRFYGAGIPAYTEKEMRDFCCRSRFGGAVFRKDRLLFLMEMTRPDSERDAS